MAKLNELTITETARGLEAGEFSSQEMTRACLDAMEAACDLNCFITETPDTALRMAALSDDRRARGDARGALDGVPLGIKDLFCTDGIPTTAASHILDGFVPPYESTVSRNLWDAGAVLLGKTNLDEFAMGSASVTSYYGPVKSPWKGEGGKDLAPGGSSGGSASAVSARLCPGAAGTDTGGSIRQPAALTGVVGLKPTYGRCSRWGIIAFASSLDQAGPLTRTVEDAAIMLRGMAGYDPKDSTSANVETPDFRSALSGDVKDLKVGVPAEYTLDGMPGEIQKLWDQGAEWLRERGAEIKPVSLPHTKYALPAYYIVAPAEASSNLARYDGVRYGLRVDGESLDEMYEHTRGEGFGAEVKRRVLIGAYVLSAGYYDAYYVKAQQVRTRILRDFEAVFADVDVLLTPTAPNTAFGVGEKMDDPVAMYLNDVFTVPASLAGLPGVSVPAGLAENGLPLGLQIMAKPFDETTLFRAAHALEQSAGFSALPNGLKG